MGSIQSNGVNIEKEGEFTSSFSSCSRFVGWVLRRTFFLE